MAEEVGPTKNPLTPGRKTTEFLATAGGMFLTALLAVLAAFDLIHLSEGQKEAVFEFSAASWIFLPIAYAFARAYLKGKAVQGITADGVVRLIETLRK